MQSTAAPGQRRAYVAFEGGGAKGVAHIGVLKEIEEQNIDVLGYAGTSAGAIIATLAAAGFKADEIYCPDTGKSILELIFGEPKDGKRLKPHAVLGITQWHRLTVLRWLGEHCVQIAVGALAAFLLLLVLPTIPFIGLSLNTIWLIFLSCVIAICGFFVVLGVASLKVFRKNLQKLLVKQADKKRSQQNKGRPVTFGEMPALGWKPLKIVASDLNKRGIAVFGSYHDHSSGHDSEFPDYDEVQLADAVCASICIPFAFSPWVLGDRTYVDGGVLSNLPAWVFEEERALQKGTEVIAVEIVDASSDDPSQPLGFGRWLPAFFKTALFGAAALSKRVDGALTEIALDVKKADGEAFGLLDFDAEPDEFAAMVKAARARANTRLEKPYELQEQLRMMCAATQKLFEAVVQSKPGNALFHPASNQRIRVAVAHKPRGARLSWLVDGSSGFTANDPDADLLIPDEGSLVGLVASTGRAMAAKRSGLDKLAEVSLFGDNLQKRIWPELEWSIAVPIYDAKNELQSVVTIDSDLSLAQTPQEMLKAFRERIEYVQQKFGNLYT